MDKSRNILLDEYFDKSTSEIRKQEIRNELLNLPLDHPDRILFEVGEEIAMEDKVQQLAKNIESISGSNQRSWPYLKVAASIVFIFLTIFAIYKVTDSSKTRQELFAAYYEPYPDLISVRISDESDQAWEKALKSYQAGDYNEAIKQFDTSVVPTEYEDDVAFYKAMAFLALNQSEEAISLLKTLKEGKYHQQVRWYLALGYIQKDEPVEARDLLKEIGPDDFNWSEAQHLIDEIN